MSGRRLLQLSQTHRCATQLLYHNSELRASQTRGKDDIGPRPRTIKRMRNDDGLIRFEFN